MKGPERSRDHHNPSFSSTLLDAIYRSIDEGAHPQQQHMTSYHKTHKQGGALKEQNGNLDGDYRRDYMIEKWMERKGNQKMNSLAEIPRTYRHSSSSSSDSSSKGGFSSSESERSTRYENKPRYSTSCYSMKKLRPIRTDTISRRENPHIIDKYHAENEAQAKPSYNLYEHEGGRGDHGGSVKAKSKALKVYEEIKKASGGGKNRDPISPGAKLASFLNSLFNAKKEKIISTGYGENFPKKTINTPKSGHSSTCSSASSFSRSCLSKNSSSKGNLGDKRSVRFCPNVSEVLSGNKDHVPKGHKQEPVCSTREEAETMVKNYQKKRENREEVYEDDDGASCASSDLFELDPLSGVGIGGGFRFSEELPLYETTNLSTNIVNGFIM